MLQNAATEIKRRSRGLIGQSSGQQDNLAEARGTERNRRAVLTAATAIFGRGLSIGLALLTVPLTLNYLGPERYGMWLTISSMIALLAFTDLGIGNGLLNAVSRTLARGDLVEARRQISSAMLMLTVIALGLAGLAVVIFPIIPWAGVLAVSSQLAASEAGPAIAAWLACFLISLPLSAAAQVRIGRQEGYLVQVATAMGNLVAVGALLLVIATHQGVPALVIAMAGPPLVAAAFNSAILFKRDAPHLSPRLGLADLNTGVALLRSGSMFFVLQVAITIAFTADTLVVAQLVGPEGVAEYGIAYRLFMIPAGLIAISLSPLWPAYGEAIERGDLSWVRATLRRSVKAGFLTSAVAAIALVALGQAIIEVWVGRSIAPPFALLLGLGIWIIQSTVGTAVAMFLNGAHEIRVQAAAAIVMAICNLALSIWLTARIGVAGVMWGTVIAYGAFVLVPMALYVPNVVRRIETRHATSVPPAPLVAPNDA